MQKEFCFGNSKVIVNDCCCRNQTEEERNGILARVSLIAYSALVSQAQKKLLNEASA